MRTIRVTFSKDAAAEIEDLIDRLRQLPYVEAVSPEEESGGEHFIGFRDNQYHIIDWKDGCYITVEGRHTVLFTKDGRYFIREPLSRWEAVLTKCGWFRSHRAFLINLAQVVSVSPMVNSTMNVQLTGRPEKIPVSRSYSSEFRKHAGLR